MNKSDGYNSPKGKANNAVQDQKPGHIHGVPSPQPGAVASIQPGKKTTDKEPHA
jgi:hypothetical protein